MSAEAWARYGEYVLAHRERFADCFVATPANSHYGLGWWLTPLASHPDIGYASGSGGQALYLIPSERTAVAKLSNDARADHAAFLRRLLDTAALTKRTPIVASQ